jgi:DNA invertase Pin-like site-specific DNA recombinase
MHDKDVIMRDMGQKRGGARHARRLRGSRLTRALSDFAKLVEVFDRRGVSFVSITQQFNTTTSIGAPLDEARASFALGGVRATPGLERAKARLSRSRHVKSSRALKIKTNVYPCDTTMFGWC